MPATSSDPREGTTARKASEVDSLVGRRLKLRRVLLGMSQQDVADHCAISAQQIHKYEKGESRITASRLVQFGEVLGVPVSWFFVDIEKNPELPEDLLRLVGVQDHLDLLLIFRQIDDPLLKWSLIEMARTFTRAEAHGTSNIAKLKLADTKTDGG